MAVRRTFQNGRVSWTPMIRFTASMTATNRLAESQSRATSPNEMMPVGAVSCKTCRTVAVPFSKVPFPSSCIIRPSSRSP